MKSQHITKLGLAVILAGIYSSGVTGATVNGTATATVIAPLILTETTPMSFGTIAAGATGGTVVLSTAGARAVTGDVNAIAAGPGAAGAFTVQGEAAQAYTMTIAPGTLSDGLGNTMAVGTFVYTPPVLTGGADAFNVGATLTVGGSQAAGAYSTGTLPGGAPFVITANYN